MPLPGHPGTGPHRQRQGTMGHTMEAGTERLRFSPSKEESTKCQPRIHR